METRMAHRSSSAWLPAESEAIVAEENGCGGKHHKTALTG
jgi:hypothetical protein